MQLEFGPQKVYPRLKIEEEEQEDLKAMAEALGPMIDRGLEVEQGEILSRFKLPEPKAGAKLLRPATAAAPETPPGPAKSFFKQKTGVFKRGEALPGTLTAAQGDGASTAQNPGGSAVDVLTDRMDVEAAPAIDKMLSRIEAMIGAASGLDELRAMILEGFPDIESDELAEVLAQGLLAGNLGGRVSVEAEAE